MEQKLEMFRSIIEANENVENDINIKNPLFFQSFFERKRGVGGRKTFSQKVFPLHPQKLSQATNCNTLRSRAQLIP